MSNAENVVVISADSHVIEPTDLWAERLPASMRESAPTFAEHKPGVGFMYHPGGHDPIARRDEMATDGVHAEVLYPTLCLALFQLEDAKMQEACFRAYNDWIVEYCGAAPDQLVGVAAISVYDIEHAVAELERCRKAGLRGAMVWQSPHDALPFSSNHYDRLWAAAQDHEVPISLHILTGHGNSKESLAGPSTSNNLEQYRRAVNLKMMDAAGALFELMFYGALDRYPRLKIVTVENEIGWMPFLFQQWDSYCTKFKVRYPSPLRHHPSEYLKGQIYGTFFNDRIGGRSLAWWGEQACMWSNDFPHQNSTWPNSRRVIAEHLGHLPQMTLERVLSVNAAALYGLDLVRLGALRDAQDAR